MDFNDPLYKKALEGDEEATKIYCGSYLLVQEYKTLQYFRCKEDIPFGFNKIDKYAGLSVYDKDGFLLSQFWSLPRI